MANETEETLARQPEPLVADEETMTVYGQTLGELMGAAKQKILTLESAADSRELVIGEKVARIGELEQCVTTLEGQVTGGKIVIADLRQKTGLQRLPTGSIQLLVTLDVDAATPLLAQADQAGEDPEVYIQRQVADALLAVHG